MANFEVIEIVDDRNTYPVLLEIDWAIDMNAFIELKKRTFHLKINRFELQCHWTLQKGCATVNRSAIMKKVKMSWIRFTR